MLKSTSKARNHKWYGISIRKKIIISIYVIIAVMSIFNVFTMIKSRQYNNEYNKTVSEIATFNTLSEEVKNEIDTTMENIVDGRIKFQDGKQYKTIKETKEIINSLKNHKLTNEKKMNIEVALRTLDTTNAAINRISLQIKQNSKVSDNQEVLKDIRVSTQLFQDTMRDIVSYDLNTYEEFKNEMWDSFYNWFYVCVFCLLVMIFFSMLSIWIISGSISGPIGKLCKTTKEIANGNFDIHIDTSKNDEIDVLGKSINSMAVNLKSLLEKSVKEQEGIKKSELKVLQAQINPHFLYNTLDTILWTAEAKNTKRVIEIVKALSSFFRISLSKGKEWITIKDEIDHVKSYLTIQKIRYRDILNYNIDINDKILKYKILKLFLQPLVENALYHGIKNKRFGGYINIIGYKKDVNIVCFEITDNGIGITEEKLDSLKEELENTNFYKDEENETKGFGLINIQKRIQLYYGKEYGISIFSNYKVGTKVVLSIPVEEEPKVV
ncbi:MAG: sensor histidine kinase [Clostridiales bacterium]